MATATASLASLAGNTSYTYKAYSDSGCATELTSTSTDADFLTQPAQPGQPMVSAGVGSGNLAVSSSLSGGSGALSKWQYTTDDGTSWKDVTTATDNNLNVVVSTQSNGTALSNGISYTFKVRAVNSAGTGPASQASTATAPTNKNLTAGNATTTSLKLTIANHSGDWYYKYTSPSDGPCSSSAVTGTTTVATALQSGTSYIFKAYSDSGCTTELATAAATSTLGAATLSATDITHNAATLTIANHSGDWYYKADAGLSTASCSSAVSSGTTTASLTGLAGNTSYTYKAYSDSGCVTELTSTSTDADFLTQPAQPSKPSVTTGAGSGKLTVSSSLAGGNAPSASGNTPRTTAPTGRTSPPLRITI